MASAATFDFIFENAEKIDSTSLRQGDLLARTPALADAIREAHAYYATAEDYSHFLVLTQSCDLVRRRGQCKSRYITICAVRPLTLAVERELENYLDPVPGCPIPVGNLEQSVLAKQYMERILNNTVDGMFFIPRGSADGVNQHLCAFLALSVALRVSHYDGCLSAKVAQAHQIFAAKIGSIASNLYARIATPDLHETNDPKLVNAFKAEFFDELGLSKVVWLTPAQRDHLTGLLNERQAEAPDTELTLEEANRLLRGLPKDPEAIADAVIQSLLKRGMLRPPIPRDDLAAFLSDEPAVADIKRRAKNLIINDARFMRLTRRTV